MEYLHTMVRVGDLDKSLAFYCGALGLKEMRRMDNEKGRYTLVFLAAPGDEGRARDEKSPLGKMPDEAVETIDENTYGPLKALCEQAAERALPGRTTIIRPGLIVGPDDNTDRFTWWPARACPFSACRSTSAWSSPRWTSRAGWCRGRRAWTPGSRSASA